MIDPLATTKTEYGLSFKIPEAAEKINELVDQINFLTRVVADLCAHTHDSRFGEESIAGISMPHDLNGKNISTTWLNNQRLTG